MGMRFIWVASPDAQGEQGGQQAVADLRDLMKILQ
jgi:hypothetical protein